MHAYFEKLGGFCCRYALLVVVLGVTLGLLASYFTFSHFRMNSDTADLIARELPWRQHQIAFDQNFPQNDNLIVTVVEGATPELTEQSAQILASKLIERKNSIHSVRRPDAGDFFAHNGLLFMPVSEVKRTTEQLLKAQPFLGALASDPSLRGVMNSLSTALMGVEQGQASLQDLQRPISAFAKALSDLEAGQTVFFSWQTLLSADPPHERQLRKIILVKPQLDYGALSPGKEASNIVRQLASDLHLTPEHGVSVRLTGQIPLSDEEFGSLGENIEIISGLMLAAILLMVWLAVRSVRIMFAIFLTLIIGLITTTAVGLLATGALNMISVAFIPLFVGLGIDFGIQYAVRYRAERFETNSLEPALIAAEHNVGMPLAVAAIAVAAGFLAFVPTDYKGVAELGLIAGLGMVVAFVLSITMLPALLKLLKPRGEAAEIGIPQLAGLDRALARRRKTVLLVMAALTLIGLMLIPLIRFDFNPLHLRNPKSESVATLLDLMKNPENAPNTIDILTPNLEQMRTLKAKLRALPEVAQVLSVDTFVPEDQSIKLTLIADAQMLLDTTLNPFMTEPLPSDAETAAALIKTMESLRRVASDQKTAPAQFALTLADRLQNLAQGSAAQRQKAEAILITPLSTMLAQLRGLLLAQPINQDTLPEDIKRDWIAADGQMRLQAFPSGNADDNATLAQFSKAVRAIEPKATGSAIAIQESGNTIVSAFTQAGIISLLIITLLLVMVLRNLRDVLLALGSLLFAGLMTMVSCVVIGLQINFANIIALPLLFGIGMAFNIYYLMAWRAGSWELLQSPLAKAIVFSALTTATGFGTLWLSSHPGTASMGQLLMISLGWTLITTLIFLPALLGPARKSPSPSK